MWKKKFGRHRLNNIKVLSWSVVLLCEVWSIEISFVNMFCKILKYISFECSSLNGENSLINLNFIHGKKKKREMVYQRLMLRKLHKKYELAIEPKKRKILIV